MSVNISITDVNELIEARSFVPPNSSSLVLETYPTEAFNEALPLPLDTSTAANRARFAQVLVVIVRNLEKLKDVAVATLNDTNNRADRLAQTPQADTTESPRVHHTDQGNTNIIPYENRYPTTDKDVLRITQMSVQHKTENKGARKLVRRAYFLVKFRAQKTRWISMEDLVDDYKNWHAVDSFLQLNEQQAKKHYPVFQPVEQVNQFNSAKTNRGYICEYDPDPEESLPPSTSPRAMPPGSFAPGVAAPKGAACARRRRHGAIRAAPPPAPRAMAPLRLPPQHGVMALRVAS